MGSSQLVLWLAGMLAMSLLSGTARADNVLKEASSSEFDNRFDSDAE
jgi:hypothetical protein